MPLSRPKQKKASIDFVIASYHADAAGCMVPQIPEEGPCRGHDGAACRLKVHHHRQRKTGPEHELTVLWCSTHRRGFTLYPPGHVPYGRQPVVNVAADGTSFCQQEDSQEEVLAIHFEGSFFQAALDAAAGKYWNPYNPQYDSHGGPDQWWSTQRLKIARAVDWFALGPAVNGQNRSLICSALEVDGLLVELTSKSIESSGGYRASGAAVRAVLAEICQGECLVERLIKAGHQAGLWGRPYQWDADVKVLRSLKAHSAERDRDKCPGGAGPPLRN